MNIFDTVYQWRTTGPMQPFIITPPSFYKDTLSAKALTLSVANINHAFEHLGIYMNFASRSQCLVGHNQVIMALTFTDNHVLYYQVDAQCSIGLGQTYFPSPDYLVVQCWVHATFLHPDIINQNTA